MKILQNLAKMNIWQLKSKVAIMNMKWELTIFLNKIDSNISTSERARLTNPASSLLLLLLSAMTNKYLQSSSKHSLLSLNKQTEAKIWLIRYLYAEGGTLLYE
jgi:hypothetical protein